MLTWTNTLLCGDQRETEGEISPDARTTQGLYLASGVVVFLLDFFAAVVGGRQPREVESARQGQQRSEEQQQRRSHGTANHRVRKGSTNSTSALAAPRSSTLN